jgi:hypothetical protein
MLTLLSLLFRSASAAPCDPLPPIAAEIETMVRTTRFAEVPGLIDRAEIALACPTPVPLSDVLSLFRAQALWFSATGLREEAQLTNQSIATLEARIAGKVPVESEQAELHLEPPDATASIHISGQAWVPGRRIPAGLHALQIDLPGDAADRGVVLLAFPGDVHVIEIPKLEPTLASSPPTLPAPKASSRGNTRSVLLGTAGGLAMAGGILGVFARAQISRAEDAHSIAEVNAAERTQLGLGASAYTLLGASGVLLTVGVTR